MKALNLTKTYTVKSNAQADVRKAVKRGECAIGDYTVVSLSGGFRIVPVATDDTIDHSFPEAIAEVIDEAPAAVPPGLARLRADDDAEAIRESVLADQENSLAEARVTPSIEDVATSPAGWRAPEPVPPAAPADVVTERRAAVIVRRGRKAAGSRKAANPAVSAGGVSPEAALVLKALFRSPALRDTPAADRAGHWVDYQTINKSDAPHDLAARRVPGYMAGLQRRGLVECRMDKPGKFSAKMTAAGVALAQEAGR
jgi:hypothetical protein